MRRVYLIWNEAPDTAGRPSGKGIIEKRHEARVGRRAPDEFQYGLAAYEVSIIGRKWSSHCQPVS